MSRRASFSRSGTVGGGSGWNCTFPSEFSKNTPSGTSVWKCRFRFRADPNLWMQVTAPQRGFGIPCCRAQRRCHAKSARRNNVSVRPISLGRHASRNRSCIGRVKTHCRTGTAGNTWSRRCAAESDIRRPAHDGQRPRFLQEKATSSSSWQVEQRTRAKPWLKESAAQVALKLGANEARQFTAGIPILGFDEKGSQVFADNAVEQSLFRLATLVANPRRGRTADFQRLICGGRAHGLPRSTTSARLQSRRSASERCNTGGLRLSGIPDAVRISDTHAAVNRSCGCKVRRTLSEGFSIQNRHTLCASNSPEHSVFSDRYLFGPGVVMSVLLR